MSVDAARLGDEQAQRLLVELFELLPAAGKPGYDELASLLDDLRDAAPAELAGPLARLDDSAECRGELARQALAALATQDGVAPLLAQAAERAGRAHMMALPELIAGVVLVLAVLPSQLHRDAQGALTVEWQQLRQLSLVLASAAKVLKALPQSLLAGRG